MLLSSDETVPIAKVTRYQIQCSENIAHTTLNDSKFLAIYSGTKYHDTHI